ncbi:AraC family transcriptional regulator [Streptomyces kaniharaensis]|uniref:AraC family transcriptional regulator n=1 Tax=Streptomyces kaniharaensis TaxID=212423 RepID=A0A6N7KQX3_9ACTN|nr:helix-turn-helix domain-containing protein [Streptomyces kaniharaensis]MQS12818.1 AraC family transcriptional regulator [Streptomyces kaniharaensis]
MDSPGLGRGVLHPARAAEAISVDRLAPDPEVARFVEFYWLVRWDRRGLPPYEQKVLAHPNVHLVFEAPRARVYGVDRSLFVRRLEGAGHVLGVKFRPGAFRPLAGRPVVALADRSVPAAEFFGPETDRLNEEILGAPENPAALADAFLRPRLPAPDPVAEEVAAVVDRITGSPDLRRVDDLAREFGVTLRRLQRLFAEYVGASPKWVLRRARLHEAAERADAGSEVDLAALAADLGYADQAHFTRDFTAAVGTSPARYAGGACRAAPGVVPRGGASAGSE